MLCCQCGGGIAGLKRIIHVLYAECSAYVLLSIKQSYRIEIGDSAALKLSHILCIIIIIAAGGGEAG